MRRRVSSLSCLRHIVCYRLFSYSCFFFFFNDTATTEIYTLSLHDALPISFGSLFAQAFHLSPVERKTLLVAGAAGDRKSTRLNSSHSQISYAVFCLKKKKKNKILV